jgi:hypothetical protein
MGHLRKLRRSARFTPVEVDDRPGAEVIRAAGDIYKNSGRYNAYHCPDCGGYTVTLNVDDGVVPSKLRCRRTEGCAGMGESLGFPKGPTPDKIKKAARFEWYRPYKDDPAMSNPILATHVNRGGLLLRAISE